MASFEEMRARKVRDEEESFLDWEGEATLFAEMDEEEDDEAADETADALVEEDDEVEDDEEIEELDFS